MALSSRPILAMLLAGLAFPPGCAPDATGPAPPGQPAGWDDGIRVRGADDVDPDPGVVEINLEARVASLPIIAAGPTTFTRIGGDGGLLPAPVPVAEPVLTPGERADLLVVPEGAPGTEVAVRWIAFDRGFGTAYNRPPEDLFVVRFEGSHLESPALPVLQRIIEPIPTDGAVEIGMTLTFESGSSPIRLGINGVAFEDSEPLMAHVGKTQVWTVTNTFDFAHPFHLHGFFFQVLSPAGPLEWKDTVNVPVDGTVRLVVRYDDRPGMWMFHCHIVDHADAGMMGMLMLMEPH
jgi:FtsP/CotA-like multicopper oxidase with cupredoxin domain